MTVTMLFLIGDVAHRPGCHVWPHLERAAGELEEGDEGVGQANGQDDLGGRGAERMEARSCVA